MMVAQTFVKYNGTQPKFSKFHSSKSQEYTHSEILNILTGSAGKFQQSDPDEGD